MHRDGIKDRVTQFLVLAQAMMDAHMQNNFPTLPTVTLVLEYGKRYVRIVSETMGGSPIQPRLSRSVFCFIDLTNGDLRKPEGFKKPAKHARGNIFEEDYAIRNVGPYGVAYMETNGKLLTPLGKDWNRNAQTQTSGS